MDRESPRLALRLLGALDRLAGFTMRAISVACMVVLLLLLAGNVVNRYLFTLSGLRMFSFGWFDEIVEWSFAWMVFFGAAALWREGQHFTVDVITSRLKGARALALSVAIDALCLAFFAALAWYGWELTARATDTTPIFKLSKRWLYACLPASGILMSLYTARNLLRRVRPRSRDAET